MYQPFPSTKLYFEERERGTLPEMPKFVEWPEREIYWKNLKFAWSLSSDLIPGYRLKERDRVKMIAFYFRMAYM